MIIFWIKLIHSVVFLFLSGCVLYIAYCAIFNRYSSRTTAAIVLILTEGIILIANDWQCPLTTWAEKLGASQADAASMFLPHWIADHIFGICTPIFLASSALLLMRRRR